MSLALMRIETRLEIESLLADVTLECFGLHMVPLMRNNIGLLPLNLTTACMQALVLDIDLLCSGVQNFSALVTDPIDDISVDGF